MRLLSSTALLLVLLGAALAVPAKRKLEKKSISNSLAPKAFEPVDQRLDEPAKLSDEALMEIAGENVDRAKKQASTMFCVEVHQNKQTQVDCDELNNRPIPPPPEVRPAPVPEPEPQVPEPPPPPPPAPVPQQQPEEFKFEVPCEPEMAAFYVQPPGQIVYAPTGNCAPRLPALHHVPSNNPAVYTVPAGGASAGTPSVNFLHLPTGYYPGGVAPGASGTPSINFYHLPSGSIPSTGVAPTVHVTPLSGAGGLNPTLIPVHSTGGAGIAPAHQPSLVHVIRPSPLQHHGIHPHGVVPLHGPGGLHGTHHLSGVEGTCTSGIVAKSADASPPSNEALAMKFMQDLQRNAQSSGSSSGPTMVQVGAGQAQPGSPLIMMSNPSAGGPMMSGQSGSPMMMMVSPGSGSPAMMADMRFARHSHDQEAQASGQEQPEQKADEKPQEGPQSRSDFYEAMKKQSEKGNKEVKH